MPNGGKDYEAKLRFLESLAAFAASHARDGTPLVLCGDLNVARTDTDIHPKERKPNVIGTRAEERALLERIIAARPGRRAAAPLDPDNADLFTWWAPWRNLRQRNIGWRIDYVLASGGAPRAHARAASSSARSGPATTPRSPGPSISGSPDWSPRCASAAVPRLRRVCVATAACRDAHADLDDLAAARHTAAVDDRRRAIPIPRPGPEEARVTHVALDLAADFTAKTAGRDARRSTWPRPDGADASSSTRPI